MAAVAPFVPLRLHETQIRFMNQRRGLQSMARMLVSHLHRRQSSQFLVNQRQQFVGGFPISFLKTFENPGDIAHGLLAASLPLRSFGLQALFRSRPRINCQSVHDQLLLSQRHGAIERVPGWREQVDEAAGVGCLMSAGGQFVFLEVRGGLRGRRPVCDARGYYNWRTIPGVV